MNTEAEQLDLPQELVNSTGLTSRSKRKVTHDHTHTRADCTLNASVLCHGLYGLCVPPSFTPIAYLCSIELLETNYRGRNPIDLMDKYFRVWSTDCPYKETMFLCKYPCL